MMTLFGNEHHCAIRIEARLHIPDGYVHVLFVWIYPTSGLELLPRVFPVVFISNWPLVFSI